MKDLKKTIKGKLMSINYPKIIFLNLTISILIFILFFDDTIFIFIGPTLLGFASSLFFKVNRTVHFFKLMLINALFFYFLSILIVYLGWAIIYIMDKANSDNLSFILGMRGMTLIYTILYSFGYFFGLVPQVIRERLEIIHESFKNNSIS